MHRADRPQSGCVRSGSTAMAATLGVPGVLGVFALLGVLGVLGVIDAAAPTFLRTWRHMPASAGKAKCSWV